jgi:hypothetical protein
MRMKLILLMVFLGLIFFPLALADQTAVVCKYVPGAALDPVPGSDIPLRQTAYSTTIDIPKFDPGLGVLEKVYLTIDACGRQSFQLDNEDPQPLSTFDVDHSGLIRVTVPVPVPDIVEVGISDSTRFTLPADNDGAPDFAGTDSYTKILEKCADEPANKVYDQPSDLAAFTALVAGIPETASLLVSASGNAAVTGDTGNFAQFVLTYMGAEVCVVYEYRTLSISGSVINDCIPTGLEGWTVELKNSVGNTISTTQTASDGSYSFIGLTPGSYSVVETVMPGWTAVGPTTIPVTLTNADVGGVDFHNRIDPTITTTPFSVCPGETVTPEMILEHVTSNDCSGTPTVTIGPENSYTVSCTSIAGCSVTVTGSWSVYPANSITTTPLTVCDGVTPTDAELLAQADLSACTDTPVLVRDDVAKTYTISCTDENGCPVTGSGSWSNYPECVIETEIFEVCYGVVPTDEQILAHVDLSSECTGTPTISIVPGTTTYTVTCTDANGCPCYGEGSWMVYPECTLETTPFSVCPGVTVTAEMILDYVDTSQCTDMPVVTIIPGTTTYTVTCTDANGCPCYGEGYWDVYEPCVLETTPFSVPCNTIVTAEMILDYVDTSQCTDMPVVTIIPGTTTYTVTCTDANGCPCYGEGYWDVEPCEEACETAWAFLDDWECFPKTGNWGSLTMITPGDSLTLTGDVWAGRAMCDQTKGWLVGTATITVSSTGYDLDLGLNDDCYVEDLHVWVSNTKPEVKGGFSDKRWYKSESMTGLDLKLNKPIWVAVHTSTCCSACDDEEVCTYPAP